MLLQLPWTDTGLEDLVLGWWLVDHVGDPGVPRWLNVCSGLLLVYDDGEESGNGVRVPFVFLVINPSCAQWKLLLHVLKVLVAEAIDADQGSGLGVTDVLPIMLDGRSVVILPSKPSFNSSSIWLQSDRIVSGG